jgi:hypothetical protein
MIVADEKERYQNLAAFSCHEDGAQGDLLSDGLKIHFPSVVLRQNISQYADLDILGYQTAHYSMDKQRAHLKNKKEHKLRKLISFQTPRVN